MVKCSHICCDKKATTEVFDDILQEYFPVCSEHKSNYGGRE